MESQPPELDLERELTCSICAELLYQPLTLLDCLHTFCGACLKEWFTYQAATAERSRSSPEPGSSVVNCPSCRAAVRDTRHNATVVTLLDMFVAAHPDKARSDSEKEEMAAKYKPGDQVLPQVRRRRRTSNERRADAEDQRLIEEVRELSLREVGGGSSRPRARRRRESRSADAHGRSRDRSLDSSRQRRVRDRYQANEDGRASNDQLSVEDTRRRHRRSEDGSRRVEHQSSLRSLIGSENMSERDIEREIEDFARQIQEEGLLDGLDLDNIDLSRDDDLSRRITDAYRRRQRERERPRHDASSRRSTASNQSRPIDLSASDSRPPTSDRGSRSHSRQRPHSRSMSSTGQFDDRSRPPPSNTASLDPRDPSSRARRRAGSSGRRSTAPVSPSPAEARPAARSQTDLSLRTQPAELPVQRPGITDARSSSTPAVSTTTVAAATELPASTSSTNGTNTPVTQTGQSFANRMPQNEQTPAQSPVQAPAQPAATPAVDSTPIPTSNATLRAHRPSELAMVHSSVSSPLASPTSGHQRKRSQLYPEPSISCSRCGKTHIEYELHYNCNICSGGQWNICLSCYRSGKGCQYWFGFGYGAWKKWEKAREQSEEDMPMPHMLTACRYLPPPSTPGGADGRKTLTTDDPRQRLESGTFCVRCQAWTNLCYWRCDVCNEGDWGFCNNCVNQGHSCTHMLLPLTHEATQQGSHGRPSSPRSPGRPPTAALLTGPHASSIGPFKPLTFNTQCDICQDPIPPSRARYHCYSCTSSLIPDASPGDYDICTSCYKNLVSQGQVSVENGYTGWRRCLNGHRMVIVAFTEGKVGQWRYVDRDLVGGRALRQDQYDGSQHQGKGLQKWTWKQGSGGQSWTRLATRDVKDTAPTSDDSVSLTDSFPPEGGLGKRALAKWSWYPEPGADDELLFPRGGEVREIEDVNGDWFFGTYMGVQGLFPAPYVRMAQDEG